jgi:hypothetical protein
MPQILLFSFDLDMVTLPCYRTCKLKACIDHPGPCWPRVINDSKPTSQGARVLELYRDHLCETTELIGCVVLEEQRRNPSSRAWGNTGKDLRQLSEVHILLSGSERRRGPDLHSAQGYCVIWFGLISWKVEEDQQHMY